MKNVKNPYRYKAKRTKVRGVWYDSRLEARMAMILLNNKIEFEPHREFQCVDVNGAFFKYIVDFYFPRPQEFLGITHSVRFIEVKGVLTRWDIRRLNALEYCHNLKGFIVTEPLISLWEREGIGK